MKSRVGLDWIRAHAAEVLEALGVSGGGGGSASEDHDLSDQCNGSRTTFTLPSTPVSSSVRLYFNGQRLVRGTHFTVSGSSVTVVGFVPASRQGLEAEYIPS